MDAFDLRDLLDARIDASRPYFEFLRTPDLSAGIYLLPAGAEDPQRPHGEDELYHVISGRARIVVGDEEQAVGPGSIVFVAAGVAHRFVAIEEEIVVLVVFGPAEGSRR